MAARKRAAQRQQRRKNRHGVMAGRWGRVGRPETYSTRTLISAVIDSGGVLERAASLLHCHPDTISRRAARSQELARAISLMRSRSAKVSFDREQRRRRQEQAARRELLAAEPAERPRVELVFIGETPQLVQREEHPPTEGESGPAPAQVTPPAAGRRLQDPPWADSSWLLVERTTRVVDKFHGEVLPRDRLRVPRRLAETWVQTGVAEVVATEDSGA